MNIIHLILLACVTFIAAQSNCSPGSDPYVNNTCRACDPGSANGDSVFCLFCEPGTFQPLPGQTICLPCPSGTQSARGATMCGACPEGQALFRNGTCHFCPAGEEVESSSLECRSCRDGFFKAEEGPNPCLPCPLGSFSAQFAATACIFCPENQAPVTVNGSCGQCSPGSLYDDSLFLLLETVGLSSACSSCAAGSFMNVTNVMNECFPCGGNSFSSGGATKCFPCPTGQVYINSTRSCEPECEPGFFYDESALDCKPCGFNHFSKGGTQRSCESCGRSFARMGSTTCFACPFGQSFLADIDGCGVCPDDLPYQFYSATCGFF